MEERELFAQYRKSKDRELRNRIVEQYLYIASMIAKKFVGRGVEYDDLFQIASLALIKGVDRFDETKGIKFATFITPTIAGEIKNYFRDRSRLIHLPRRISELRQSVKRTADEFLSANGRNPTAAEIAKIIGVPEEDVVSAMECSVVSLDRPADEDGMSYYDLIPAPDSFDELEQRDAVGRALACLDEEERELVSFRFGQELSQTETAKRMGVSQMYISRMERKILEKLRGTLRKSVAD